MIVCFCAKAILKADKWVKVTALFSAAFFCFTLPAYSSYNAKVIKEKVNIRVDSTAMAPSIGYLYQGEVSNVIEEYYDWCKVILPKRMYCYVAAEFLRRISDNKAEVIVDELNLRSSPSKESYIIGKVSKGTVLFIKEQKGGWFKVRGHPYAYGWVNKSFLQRIQKPNQK